MNNNCNCNNWNWNKCDKCDKCDKEHDWNNRREQCDIKSECCEGFVKQQFSLKANADYDGTIVYRTNLKVAGTVVLTNLGEYDIVLKVDDKYITVAPREMGAITACDIDYVEIRTTEEDDTSRALLCFDIQVPTPRHKS